VIAMIRKRLCKTCGKPISTFNDWISYQEYQISGMCQVCQDEIFDQGAQDRTTGSESTPIL